VGDGRIVGIGEVGSLSKGRDVPSYARRTERTKDELDGLTGDGSRDVEGVRGEEGGEGRGAGRVGGEGGEGRESGRRGRVRFGRLNDEILLLDGVGGGSGGESGLGVVVDDHGGSGGVGDASDSLLDLSSGDLLLLSLRGDVGGLDLGGENLGLLGEGEGSVSSSGLVLGLVERRRVDEVDVGVELEENESEEGLVKFEESEEDTEIDVGGNLSESGIEEISASAPGRTGKKGRKS